MGIFNKKLLELLLMNFFLLFFYSLLALKMYPTTNNTLCFYPVWEGSFHQILSLTAIVNDERQSSAFRGIAAYLGVLQMHGPRPTS